MFLYKPEPRTGSTAYELWNDRRDYTRKYVINRYHDRWTKNEDLDKGNHWGEMSFFPGTAKADSWNYTVDQQTTVNLLGLYIRKILSYLVYQDPVCMLEPTKAEDYVSAQLQQIKLNKEFLRCKIKKILKTCGLRGLIYGSGIAEIGYLPDVKHTKNPEKEGELEFRDVMQIGKIFIRNVEPRNFFYDLDTEERNLDAARFCFERKYVTPDELFSNREFNNRKAIDSIQAGSSGAHAIVYRDLLSKKMGTSDREFFCLEPLWDRKFRKFYVFVDGAEEPVHEDDNWPYDDERLPYAMLNFIDLPGEFYGLGYPVWPESLQKQINRSVTAAFDYARTAMHGAMQGPEGSVKDEVDALLAGAKFVRHPPTGKFEPLFQGPFNRDVFAVQEMAKQFLDQMMSVNEMMFGQQSQGRESATENANRTNFLMVSINDLVGKMDDFTTEIASHTDALMKQFYTKDDIVPVAGPLGEYWGELSKGTQTPDGKTWVPYSKENIRSQFDVKIISTSAPKMDPLTQSEREMVFFQRVILPATGLAAQLGAMGKTLEDVGGINVFAFIQKMAEQIGFKDISRYLPRATVMPAPIQTQTQAEAGSQPQGMQPPAGSNGQPSAPVSPMSTIAGALGGGLPGLGGRPTG